MDFFILTTVNSLALASLLFLVTIGFSLIFGLMRILNLTHGSYYVLGAYMGVMIIAWTGSFTVAVIGAGLTVAVMGILIQSTLLNRVRVDGPKQALLTVALWFMLDDIWLVIWAGVPRFIAPPPMLEGPVLFLGVSFPLYRLFLMGVGLVVALAMWLLIERTKIGAVIRAGADNAEMVRAMGIDIVKIFIFTFGLGSLLVGMAGVLGGPMLGVDPGLSFIILPLALVVVIIGGLGTLYGAMAGSIFVGLVFNFGRALFPEFSYFTLFVPMALVVAFRPRGLFGRS
jgi:branched-chain amino acid transport system permease protein